MKGNGNNGNELQNPNIIINTPIRTLVTNNLETFHFGNELNVSDHGNAKQQVNIMELIKQVLEICEEK
jgi:hypothetical protein